MLQVNHGINENSPLITQDGHSSNYLMSEMNSTALNTHESEVESLLNGPSNHVRSSSVIGDNPEN